jgi:hypothetical protein
VLTLVGVEIRVGVSNSTGVAVTVEVTITSGVDVNIGVAVDSGRGVFSTEGVVSMVGSIVGVAVTVASKESWAETRLLGLQTAAKTTATRMKSENRLKTMFEQFFVNILAS